MAPPRPADLGLSTARLTTRGVWGEPKDADEAIRVLRRAIELGIRYIEVAGPPGRIGAEDLVRMALHPYPSDLVLAVLAAGSDATTQARRLGVDPAQLRSTRPDCITVLTPTSLSEFERDYAAAGGLTPPSARPE